MNLSPNDPEAHVWYGEWLYSVAGRAEEGIAEARRALELDPYNSLYRAFVGQALLFSRRDDEAISHFKQVLQADPNTPLAPSLLQRAYERKGMYTEAMTLWRQTMAAGRDQEMAGVVERGFAQGGYRGAMRARAELAVRRSEREYVAPSTIATFYAIAGEKELAMDWLDKAYEERQIGMVYLKVIPQLDSLRDHPLYEALARKMNLQP